MPASKGNPEYFIPAADQLHRKPKTEKAEKAAPVKKDEAPAKADEG